MFVSLKQLVAWVQRERLGRGMITVLCEETGFICSVNQGRPFWDFCNYCNVWLHCRCVLNKMPLICKICFKVFIMRLREKSCKGLNWKIFGQPWIMSWWKISTCVVNTLHLLKTPSAVASLNLNFFKWCHIHRGETGTCVSMCNLNVFTSFAQDLKISPCPNIPDITTLVQAAYSEAYKSQTKVS